MRFVYFEFWTGTIFTFSLNPDDFSKESPDYIGCMDCGFTGTTFTLRDYGMSHDLVNQDVLSMENEGLPGVGFVEHCVVLYETNILGRGRYSKQKRASRESTVIFNFCSSSNSNLFHHCHPYLLLSKTPKQVIFLTYI